MQNSIYLHRLFIYFDALFQTLEQSQSYFFHAECTISRNDDVGQINIADNINYLLNKNTIVKLTLHKQPYH